MAFMLNPDIHLWTEAQIMEIDPFPTYCYIEIYTETHRQPRQLKALKLRNGWTAWPVEGQFPMLFTVKDADGKFVDSSWLTKANYLPTMLEGLKKC